MFSASPKVPSTLSAESSTDEWEKYFAAEERARADAVEAEQTTNHRRD